jgi:hypothetical protein
VGVLCGWAGFFLDMWLCLWLWLSGRGIQWGCRASIDQVWVDLSGLTSSALQGMYGERAGSHDEGLFSRELDRRDGDRCALV